MRYILWTGIAPLVWLAPAGCTPKQYAEHADRAAYGVIDQQQAVALGEARPFNIDYRADAAPAERRMMLSGEPIPLTGEPERVLGLNDALAITFHNNREYQDRKEQLYSSALALANARHNWSLLAGSITADASRTVVNKDGTVNSGSVEASGSFTQRLADGGRFTLGAGLALASDLLGIGSTTIGSVLEANFTQPLIRGAWRGFAYEGLYRQQRDMAFSVFAYERHKQQLSTLIATNYYRVLQRLDELANDQANIKRLDLTSKISRAQADSGQISPAQADEAKQDLLNAQIRAVQNLQGYQDMLDSFKLLLGLPIEANIALDPSELETLRARALGEEGLVKLPLQESQAIEVALQTRPDVLTQWARVRDARRDVQIAADGFNPLLDLTLGIRAPGTEPRKPFRVQFDDHTRFASLAFDYDLDQTDNRDAYRGAMIARDRAERDNEEFLDTVRLEVRRAYRQLEQAATSFSLQTENLQLARRRLKLNTEQLREGLISTFDLLRSEDDLRNAQNGLTSALVSYETTRISFLATLGMIDVDENGKIHEREEPFLFERLGELYGPDAQAGR